MINYRRRQITFWGILVLLLAVAAIRIFMPLYAVGQDEPHPVIRAGICGEVRQPAVYSMPRGSDLSMLIRRAGGLSPDADTGPLDLSLQLSNDSIYHIGSRPVEARIRVDEPYYEASLASLPGADYLAGLQPPERELPPEINILYVGLPAMFVIINYMPQLGRVNLTHLPAATVFPHSRLRLVDAFLLLGPGPVLRLISHQLQIPLAHYIIQDKFGFQQMIDLLGGVELDADEAFSSHYRLRGGRMRLNGFHTWEYVRFLDMRRIQLIRTDLRPQDLITEDPYTADPTLWQQAYELRHQRQRYVLEAVRQAFNQLPLAVQMNRLTQVVQTFETDLTAAHVAGLYQDQAFSLPAYSYGQLGGYYENNGKNLFFYPDIPSFTMLRNELIREALVEKETKRKTIY